MQQYSSKKIVSHLKKQVEDFARVYTSWEKGEASKQIAELIEKKMH